MATAHLLDFSIEELVELSLPLFDFADLFFDFLVTLLKLHGLGAEHVNIVVETVVLLLGLDEGGYNFLDVRNAGSLLDLFESVFDNFEVPEVLVHQLSLLLVGVDNFEKSALEDDDGVREVRALGGFCGFLVLVHGFVFKFNHLFLLFQSQLQLLDFVIESLALVLGLSLERNDLVVGLLCDIADCDVIFVLHFGLAPAFLDLLVVARALVLGGGEFLSQHVNLEAHLLVLSLGHVQPDHLVVYHLVARGNLNLRLLFL